MISVLLDKPSYCLNLIVCNAISFWSEMLDIEFDRNAPCTFAGYPIDHFLSLKLRDCKRDDFDELICHVFLCEFVSAAIHSSRACGHSRDCQARTDSMNHDNVLILNDLLI